MTRQPPNPTMRSSKCVIMLCVGRQIWISKRHHAPRQSLQFFRAAFLKYSPCCHLRKGKKYRGKKTEMWHLSDWFGVLLKEFSFFVSMSWSFFLNAFCAFFFSRVWPSQSTSRHSVFLWLWLEKFDNWQNHWSSLKFVCPIWYLPVHFSITFLHFSLFFRIL